MPIQPNTTLANTELAHFGLTEQEIQHTLGVVKVRDVDYADLYFESCLSESVSMEEGLVKRAVKSVSQGAGVRATAGEKTGFAYSAPRRPRYGGRRGRDGDGLKLFS